MHPALHDGDAFGNWLHLRWWIALVSADLAVQI